MHDSCDVTPISCVYQVLLYIFVLTYSIAVYTSVCHHILEHVSSIIDEHHDTGTLYITNQKLLVNSKPISYKLIE